MEMADCGQNVQLTGDQRAVVGAQDVLEGEEAAAQAEGTQLSSHSEVREGGHGLTAELTQATVSTNAFSFEPVPSKELQMLFIGTTHGTCEIHVPTSPSNP